MFRTRAAMLLISTALTASAAAAQTTTAPAAAPPMGSSGAMSTTSSSSGATDGKFVTQQGMNEFRASKFVGIDVYGSDNQKIGDINEILLDKNGAAKAVIIGVGGFLGIGEKNVAVPFSALEWMNTRPATTAAASTGAVGTTAAVQSSAATAPATTGSTGMAGTAGTGMAGTAGTGTAGTGMAGTAGTAVQTRSPDEMAAYNGYPDHAMLRMSKADLQNAPTFKYVSDMQSAAATTAPATTVPGATAPRQ